MKTHGPQSPQSQRGLRNRRSLPGVLDARRMAEADLRAGEMVSPFGKGFFKVKNPGGATEYIVADQTGGRTFAPGSSVVLGSFTGLPGEVVIGGSPPGKKGGSSRTRSPRRRGTAATPANQYAFGIAADGDLRAMLYADATYVSTLGTSAANGSCTVVDCILTDSSLVVGDGSVVLYDSAAEQHKVWDVDGNVTYSYSAPAGWSILSIYPRYYDGAIYWVEYETGITGHLDATGQIRLRTAATDLTGESTIATATMTATDEVGFDHFHEPFLHNAAVMVDADGAVVYAYADPEVTGHGTPSSPLRKQYRIALSGGATTSRYFDADTYPIVDVTATNYPTAGSPAGGFRLFDGTNVYSKLDDATNEATILYTPSASGQAASINFSPAGTSLQFCHGTDSSDFHIYRNNALVASSVDFFDTTQGVTAMFYFGEE